MSSYASLILVFSGLYFLMNVVSDYHDQTDAYRYYQSEAEKEHSGAIPYVIRRTSDLRAFYGISKRSWTGLRDHTPWTYPDDKEDPPITYLIKATEQPMERIITYRQENWLFIYLHCLHLSVITITTVGYGNISPNAWFAKIACDIEAIRGTVLLVLALGMVFSSWRSPLENLQ